MLYDKNDFRISEMGVSALQLLERRIAEDGVVLPGGILTVEGINKIQTIEASGIGLACITGQVFGCPVLFAKKNRTRNLFGEFWTATVHSFTHGDTNTILVSKDYIGPEDRVLIVDDFLANGAALHGLISLVRQAGATVVGAGIAIEKAFQPGGELIRSEGVRVESLARIKSMSDDGQIEFC